MSSDRERVTQLCNVATAAVSTAGGEAGTMPQPSPHCTSVMRWWGPGCNQWLGCLSLRVACLMTVPTPLCCSCGQSIASYFAESLQGLSTAFQSPAFSKSAKDRDSRD